MKKKNYLKKLLLIVIIIISTMFIILPPIFRVAIADVNLIGPTENKNKNNNITILSCKKYDLETSTLVTSRTRYNKEDPEKPEQNFITYEKTSQNNELVSQLPSYKTPAEEIEFFSNIDGIEITVTDQKTTILISKYIVDINDANFTLAKYFGSEENQREFYKEQGYKCEETKS